jgi:sensor c-di-GMP phosphodiesterase-like protein
MPRLNRALWRRPQLAGNLCGCGLALAMGLLICATSIGLKVREIDRGHAALFRHMENRRIEVTTLLDELNRSYPADCTAENRNMLRSLLFKHRLVGDIGILDGQSQLVCNTSLGDIYPPLAPNTGGFAGQAGHYYLNAPLPLAGETVFVTLVERGRFQVALDDNLSREIKLQYSDVLWAGRNAERTTVFRGDHADMTSPYISADMDHLHLAKDQPALLVTNTLHNYVQLSAQTVLRLSDLLADYWAMLLIALGLCILLGFLAADVVTRRVRHYQSMDHRIRYLCRPHNVVCHYQPIRDLASGRTIGCEVLARLHDREKLLYPDQFIPALVRQNLGWAFDTAVSSRALAELGAALPVQESFKIALNFFPNNLQRDRVHDHLYAALQATGRKDLQLELEVTEYNFSPEIVPELRRLKADGYLIAIDDFGTGYSNLGMVKRVAPDFLKIDKSFVFELEDASLRSSLIPEIVAIAKAVDSRVVAEGIENAAQATQLKALGVEYGQGYYFAKPMPLQAFLDYLATENQAARSA